MFSWFKALLAKNNKKAVKVIDLSKYTDEEIDKKVHIQSTQYDRKRKLSDSDLFDITSRVMNGESFKTLANTYGVDVRTIRYNIDPEYRTKRIKQGRTAGTTPVCISPEAMMEIKSERASYKRDLVTRGLVTIASK